ncbi:MAG TPA: branched-chain amino acid transaminase [Polyangiaceae bacterium]|nr:branched-chain amino acid transaminase [Polyangiaceae bacterium]
MHDRDGLIWYDGKLVPWREATTHVLTHSLHYGLSVFEGIRAHAQGDGASAVFRLDSHLRRLYGSAHAFGLVIPYSQAELKAAILTTLRENRLSSAYVRPLVFLGPEKIGVSIRGAGVHVVVAAFEWQSYLALDVAERGARVKTASFRRSSVDSTLPRAKVASSYTNSILSHMEAVQDGYDEALVLDTQGLVAEGSGENLFIVRDGELLEPVLSSALFGVTRDSIATLARELGYQVRSTALTRDDVYLADEAFFTGTAAGVLPIVELDRRRIGDGKPGVITQRLRAAYSDAVTGRDPRHRAWLTPVQP